MWQCGPNKENGAPLWYELECPGKKPMRPLTWEGFDFGSQENRFPSVYVVVCIYVGLQKPVCSEFIPPGGTNYLQFLLSGFFSSN